MRDNLALIIIGIFYTICGIIIAILHRKTLKYKKKTNNVIEVLKKITVE